jgi:hypothetical protein
MHIACTSCTRHTMIKTISRVYVFISITDQGIELLLETENAKSAGAVAAAESSSDDQAYDSCWPLSSATKPVHENVSIANIMSLGQHFVTLAPTMVAAGQDAHATIHTVTYARAIIVLLLLLRRRYRSEPNTTDHVRAVAFDHFHALLLPLHHSF